MYKIIEISSKSEIEQLGTKEKFWVNDVKKGCKQLFKIGRENTGENWAEKVACELAKLIELPHAQYELAKFEDKIGTISDSFVPNNSRFIHGNELLAKIDREYPADQFYRVRDYKLEIVLNLVRLMERNNSIMGSLNQFIGYIVFDCLIANQDRHHENWGYLIDETGNVTLAPTYDHAAGFGCKVSAEDAKKRVETNDMKFTVESFCRRAKTPFYNKDEKKVSTYDACRIAAKFDKDAFCDWVDRVSEIQVKDLENIFEQIPSEWIKKDIITFSIRVIQVNQKRLVALKEEVCL
jgi:hypothetical protein